MKKNNLNYLLFLSLLFGFVNISCSVFETIANISRLKFKLDNVNSFSLNGVDVSNKSRLADFSTQEILKISSAVAGGQLPVSFILNIDARNPNDGTGGYPRTNASIKSFPWRLLIDDKETVSGNISNPVYVPGTGESTTFPLTISLDLMKFFNDRGYESLINLALTLGGNKGSSSRLTVFAQPVVTSPLGDISYPNELKIVNVEYTN
jgi:hypothetical protein